MADRHEQDDAELLDTLNAALARGLEVLRIDPSDWPEPLDTHGEFEWRRHTDDQP